MKVLLTIPHVFAPQEGSLYSSQTEAKRAVKQLALRRATLENLDRHGERHWIHASLGLAKPVVTREQASAMGVDLTIQLYTPPEASLAQDLVGQHPQLEILAPPVSNYTEVPAFASRRALEQAAEYDLVGYMEDDLLIEDPEFFAKILMLVDLAGTQYAFLPHRCEQIPGRGDVILSGDPDGGRPDLFWDTRECIEAAWPLGPKQFYRATNPHSGCYFLSSSQAQQVLQHWQQRNWCSEFQLSGPLEQAGSGMLLPVLKVMKPTPNHYRFLMVRHLDDLWRRHAFEPQSP
jgi:hypothetical protein